MPREEEKPHRERLRLGRRSVAGHTYAVTICCVDKQSFLDLDEVKQVVSDAIIGLVGRGVDRLDAFVVMPDHLHILFALGQTKELAGKSPGNSPPKASSC